MSVQQHETGSIYPENLKEAQKNTVLIFLYNAFQRVLSSTEMLDEKILRGQNSTSIELSRDELLTLVDALSHYVVDKRPDEFLESIEMARNSNLFRGFMNRTFDESSHYVSVGFSIGSKAGGLLAAKVTKNLDGSMFTIEMDDLSQPFLQKSPSRLSESQLISAFRQIADVRDRDAQELASFS